MSDSSQIKKVSTVILLTGALVFGAVSPVHADDGASNSTATSKISSFFKHLISKGLALDVSDDDASTPSSGNASPSNSSAATPAVTPVQLAPPPPPEPAPQLAAPVISASVRAPALPAVQMPVTPTPLQASVAPRVSVAVDHHKHEAILFGGVDDDKTDTSIFRDSFVSLASAFKQNNWDVQVLFGAQRSCSNCDSTFSVDPIAAAIGVSSSQIPKASLEQLEAKLDDAVGKLGQGDELLLEFNTHGIFGMNSAGENSVSLAVYDESDPTGAHVNQMEHGHQHGAMVIDDDGIVQRLQTLKSQGVKIAISDDSCFGGAAVQRLEKFGCVLTQTGDKYGLGSPVSDSYVSALTASASALSPMLVANNGRVDMQDVYLDALSRGTIGIDSPYYQTPYAGVLEPQFSGVLDQYNAIENLSSRWLIKLKSNYLAVKNGRMTVVGNLDDFSAIQSFSNQYLAPSVDASKDSIYQAIAEYYMKKNTLYIQQNEIPTPSELVKEFGDIGQSLQAVADQYNQLAQQELGLESALQQSGIEMKIQLPSDYADGQPALEAALKALNGKQIDIFSTSADGSISSGWLTYPLSTSNGQQDFFDPSAVWFKASANFSAGLIQQNMLSSYPAAGSSDFKAALALAIQNAETQAWNAASVDQKNALKSIQQMIELKRQEQGFLGQGKGDKIVNLSVLVRIYSYLEARGAGQGNADVDACANFILRSL